MNYRYVRQVRQAHCRQAQYKKGFIVPLLLALFALLLIGGGAYVYMQKKQENPPVTGNAVLPQATSTAQTTEAPAFSHSAILLGKRAQFENLSADEQALISAYDDYMLGISDPGVLKKSVAQRPLDERPDRWILKYYDKEKMLIFQVGSSGKTVYPMSLIERNTWKDIGLKDCSLYSSSGIESDTYIVSAIDTGICYYKVGDASFTLVSGSALPEGETYVKEYGIADTYDLSFNAATKTLTASFFKKNNNFVHEKVGTKTFVLH